MSGIVLIRSDRAFAQSSNIIPDNTLGKESSLVVGRDSEGLAIDTIGGQAVREANLFHSKVVDQNAGDAPQV